MTPRNAKTERNLEIAAAHKAGESLSAIAKRYGISYQRAREIVHSVELQQNKAK